MKRSICGSPSLSKQSWARDIYIPHTSVFCDLIRLYNFLRLPHFCRATSALSLRSSSPRFLCVVSWNHISLETFNIGVRPTRSRLHLKLYQTLQGTGEGRKLGGGGVVVGGLDIHIFTNNIIYLRGSQVYDRPCSEDGRQILEKPSIKIFEIKVILKLLQFGLRR